MSMRWEVRTIYLYLVAFVTLMMLLFGTVNGLEAGFDYFFQPRDMYKYQMPSVVDPGAPLVKTKELQQAEIEWQAENIRYNQLQRIFNSIATIGVSLPVFLYHWRKINEREANT